VEIRRTHPCLIHANIVHETVKNPASN